MRIVMGIDPGVANTGFGVVRVAGGRMTALDGGTIEAPARAPEEQRLRTIHEALIELIDCHSPESVALESLYFGRREVAQRRQGPDMAEDVLERALA